MFKRAMLTADALVPCFIGGALGVFAYYTLLVAAQGALGGFPMNEATFLAGVGLFLAYLSFLAIDRAWQASRALSPAAICAQRKQRYNGRRVVLRQSGRSISGVLFCDGMELKVLWDNPDLPSMWLKVDVPLPSTMALVG